ncbi:MAG TPA: DUF5676 family membrane protein [Bacteroidia bacterium]|nr:DUF5676 family membrane protein [Bacteroidia bacterium]
MINELNPKRVANTLGIIFAGVSFLCAILVLIFPGATMNLFSNIFHGIDITQIAKTSISLESIMIGLIEAFILGWIIGWFFAVVYNKMR